MLDVLIASAPARDRRAGPRAVAVLLHLALVAGATMIARPAPGPTRPVQVDSVVLFPPTLDPSPSRTRDAGTEKVRGPVPFRAPEVPVPELPAPRTPGPVPAAGVGTILAGAIQWPGGSNARVAVQPENGSQVLLAAEVDEAAVVLTQGRPVYPPRLSTLGISGRVVLEFVVDSAGNVEGSSVRIVESTLAEFEPAAKAAIAASRFRAARVRGQAVRQLVRQAVSFRVP